MLTATSRMQGHSVVITLPTDHEHKPMANQDYIVVYAEDGTIFLVSKVEDPFLIGDEAAFYEADEWMALLPGEENLFDDR